MKRLGDFLIGALLLAIFGGIAGGAVYHTWGVEVGPPKFEAGVCIEYNGDELEPWHKRETWKVERVGNHHYLVRETPASLYRDVPGKEISFLTTRDYQEVPCPPKK